MNLADETYDATDETTFAGRSSAERRRDAQKQARDSEGRWVKTGANVKWNQHGNDFAGIIKGTNANNATVLLTSGDKKGTLITVPAKLLNVITSKATLSSADVPYFDENNMNVKASLKNKDFQADLQNSGSSGIKREDGYVIKGRKNLDETTKDSNPYLYQLYAPSGRSLGEYTDDAANDFENMITEDKNKNGDIVSEEPSKGQTEISEPVTASVVSRVSRDGTSIIINEAGKYFSVDLSTNETIDESDEIKTLIASGSWRKPLTEEKDVSHFITDEIDVEQIAPSYRVPKSVKEAVLASMEFGADLDAISQTHMSMLANDESVSLETIQWIKNFFSFYNVEEQSRGGYAGQKWAAKIIGDQSVDSDCDEDNLEYPEEVIDYEDAFDGDEFLYIGVGNVPGSNVINRLYCVDTDSQAMYQWISGMFVLIDELSMEEFEAESIIILDEHSARVIAEWIDTAAGTPEIDVLDTDPEERNLFTLAAAELDFEELDRSFGIIADATGYTSAERSVNASRQKRGPGGRFGGEQIPKGQTLKTKAFKKATLPNELPTIADIPALIKKWLAQAGESDSTVFEPGRTVTDATDSSAPVAPVAAAGEPIPAEPAPATDAGPTGDVAYFAIVDETDKTAVLDAVALTKTNGEATAWKREGGEWKSSPDTLKDFEGATPPAVVVLDVPEPIKSVLGQVDEFDSTNDVSTQDIPVAASGFSLSDGSFTIYDAVDLEAAITASAGITDIDFEFQVKNHVRKRAHALNRMDLVPSDWRSPTLAEIGFAETNESPLFGDFGEVITAGGVPGIADTPGDFKAARRLKAYWTHGKGALKIRWGTPGDLTRAHRHLVKYVGPGRAWGLAQEYHKAVFGVSNTTHDIATGQYRHRGKRRR